MVKVTKEYGTFISDHHSSTGDISQQCSHTPGSYE